jgi:hypothetical protein
MGRHAAPRATRSVVRRATAVSTGTLVLCLGGVAPAMAATSVGTNPPPVPKPVSDAVQQVSTMTGLPNPVPPSEPATRQHRQPTRHASQPTSHTSAARLQVTHPSTPRVATATMPAMTVLTRSAALRSSVPAVAAPTRIQPSSVLQALPAPPLRDDTQRILLVAMATLILGALAGSHINAAQLYVFAHAFA